jgi:transposase-like protein
VPSLQPVQPDEEMEIVRLYVEEGLTGAAIAQRLGRSKQTVYTVLKANHVPLKRHEGSMPQTGSRSPFPVPATQEVLMARYALVAMLEEFSYLSKRCEALEGEVRRLGGDPDNPMTIPVESPNLRRYRYQNEAKAARSNASRPRTQAGERPTSQLRR